MEVAKISYNKIAGRSVERLAALSDAIFAVAMTLLVLDLRVPLKEGIHSELELLNSLGPIAPQFIAYMMSFLTLGIFWNGQQVQLNHVERGDRYLTWINIIFLFGVSIMPFATRLLSEYIRFRVALLCYWGVVLFLGMSLLTAWRYAKRNGLLKSDTEEAESDAIERRIVVAQVCYAASAALCFLDPSISIACIVLVQLYFAFAPQMKH
jgi:uncharacterized membrane protein